MKTLKFKCTLLTDVILNVKSASEGANSTLDFIPGSCFLGIVASQLYSKEKGNETNMDLFHSGKVRFGDAHPSNNGKRALRIPASFYYAKGDSIKDNCYIHHCIEDANKIEAKSGAKAQLKQSRSGFYVMSETEGYEVKTDKSFAIKSAYDRDERRSKNAAMYGYESLCRGLELLFSVEVDDDNLSQTIKEALIGEKRVGRSRTAQYGLVDIEEFDYEEVKAFKPSNDQVVVYADSRLIFLDKNGLPTFRPEAKDLGVEGGIILWEKSQIRTFQYAPWNYTRQCYDTDRCGIEKGSVFVIEKGSISDSNVCYIGSYKNEGFGKVIYNPVFIQSTGENGLSKCKFKDVEKPSCEKSKATCESTLVKYLEKQKDREEKIQIVYEQVEKNFNASLFTGKEKFASQWGTIRSIALRNKDNKKLKSEIEEYISHGVKAEDWKGKRKNELVKFMETNQNTLWESIINLASEMAKKCSK